MVPELEVSPKMDLSSESHLRRVGDRALILQPLLLGLLKITRSLLTLRAVLTMMIIVPNMIRSRTRISRKASMVAEGVSRVSKGRVLGVLVLLLERCQWNTRGMRVIIL